MGGKGHAGIAGTGDSARLTGELALVWPLLGRQIAFHRRLVPLLDEWSPTLMKACFDDCVTAMAESAFPPIGRVAAQKVTVPDSFLETVSALVKRRKLTLSKLKQAA